MAALDWKPSAISGRTLGASLQLERPVVEDLFGQKRGGWAKARKELLVILPHLRVLASALPETVRPTVDDSRGTAAATVSDAGWEPAVLVPYRGKKARPPAKEATERVGVAAWTGDYAFGEVLAPLNAWAWNHAGGTLKVYWALFKLLTQVLPALGLNLLLYCGLLFPVWVFLFPVACGRLVGSFGSYALTEFPASFGRAVLLAAATAFAGPGPLGEPGSECWYEGHALYNETEASWQTTAGPNPASGPAHGYGPPPASYGPQPVRMVFHPPTPPSTWPSTLTGFAAQFMTMGITLLAARFLGGQPEAPHQ